MKKIFVYGILQKEHSAKEFGLTDKMYRGRALLPYFKRESLCSISEHPEKVSIVEGDVWDVSDKIEQELYDFEASFGYYRDTVSPIMKDTKEQVDAIAYLL